MSARSQYLKLIEERINDTNVLELISWVRDRNRKEAIFAFTEGPARQLAYVIEAALKLERETTKLTPPLTLRPTEQCPRCGFIQFMQEES
jgi:hypothetical protein